MELTISMLQLTATGIALVLLGALIMRLVQRREGDGFLARIFKDNRDFDSTLDRAIIGAILVFMLISFHDDLTDPARAMTVVVLFQGVFNLYQHIVTGKAIKDMQNGHERGANNGSHSPPSADH